MCIRTITTLDNKNSDERNRVTMFGAICSALSIYLFVSVVTVS